MRIRLTVTTMLVAASVVVAGCSNQPKPAPPPADTSTNSAEEDYTPIVDETDLPTVDNSIIDWADPTSVSYNYLHISGTFIVGEDANNTDIPSRVKPLVTEEFHKSLEGNSVNTAISPWYIKREDVNDPVRSVNATVTSMSPPDRFRTTDSSSQREWTLLQEAITASGQRSTYRSRRVIVHMDKTGDRWLVSHVQQADT